MGGLTDGDRLEPKARARSLGSLPRAKLLGAVALVALLAAGCAGSRRATPPASRPASAQTPLHVVQPGETLWRISRRYGVSVESIVRANDIKNVRAIRTGTRLRVPGGRDSTPGASVGRRESAATRAGLAFVWPVQGKLTSRFGSRRGRRHEGIDVSAARGTTVRAAEGGRVIHAGTGLGAYGKTIIVKHAGEYRTVYAHNHRILVKRGQFVVKGQVIAEVGSTGNATGPHLHFEVRRHDRPEDPIGHLPSSFRIAGP